MEMFAGFEGIENARSVLVVEDEGDIRGMIRLALELEGYVVFEATDGRRALEQLRAGLRPSLILLDLMMPGMNGWEFRAEQGRDPELAAIPVVLISGDDRLQQSAVELKTGGTGRAGWPGLVAEVSPGSKSPTFPSS
jgi:two-component system response regulator MprA